MLRQTRHYPTSHMQLTIYSSKDTSVHQIRILFPSALSSRACGLHQTNGLLSILLSTIMLRSSQVISAPLTGSQSKGFISHERTENSISNPPVSQKHAGCYSIVPMSSPVGDELDGIPFDIINHKRCFLECTFPLGLGHN